MFLLLNLCYTLSYRPIYRMQDHQSLFSPAVDDNGRNLRWNLFNEYFIVTYSDKSTYTRLGHCSAPSSAGMITKEPTSADNFRIDVTFSLTETNNMRDGFAIWLTKDGTYKKGDCFGRDGNFDGLLVAIVTKSKHLKVPYIGVACGTGLKYDSLLEGTNVFKSPVSLSTKIFNKKNVIRIHNVDGQLTISLAEKKNFTEIFKVGNSGLGKNYFLGISSSNSTGNSDFNILGVRFYNMEKQPLIKNIEEKDESKGSSWVVWIVFLAALGGIGYVLLPKQLRR